jgi:hypothetical protein
LSSSLPYCLLVNVGAKHSLTVVKTKVRLCLDACLSEPCHRLALSQTVSTTAL